MKYISVDTTIVPHNAICAIGPLGWSGTQRKMTLWTSHGCSIWHSINPSSAETAWNSLMNDLKTRYSEKGLLTVQDHTIIIPKIVTTMSGEETDLKFGRVMGVFFSGTSHLNLPYSTEVQKQELYNLLAKAIYDCPE